MLTNEKREWWTEKIKEITTGMKKGHKYGNSGHATIAPFAELGNDIVFVECNVCESIEVEEIMLADCENDRMIQAEKAIEIFKTRGWVFSKTYPFNTCLSCAERGMNR